MFRKILIANRGEIACRVIATARRLGIATVAVFSEADARARHVECADEAWPVGPAPAGESYLAIGRILAAARQAGAEAIHPGYGFLSENPDFAEACAQAGLTFIGPPPQAMRLMGSKSAAKTLMETAGVPILPGYHGEAQDIATFARAAEAVGYPVVVKASAAGGGKGMRSVERAADLRAACEGARREALASFGDGRLLLEKYLDRPRHIEVQIFADQHGGIVSFPERDCSIQRRHQKILEESPASAMAPPRRRAMAEAAVAAATAAGYVGAGTIEFLMTESGFWFLEMNTRLQVEHPVTEMVAGQDLVEWQIRVACGEPLPLAQAGLRIEGHSIEARIYAEDPSQGFLPSTGVLEHLRQPREDADIRIDTGVRQGDRITQDYDPLIAKLIVRGEDRATALRRLNTALAEYEIVGIATNLDLLRAIAAHPDFTAARTDTGFIGRQGGALTVTAPPPEREAILIRAAAAAARLADLRAAAARDAFSPRPFSPWAEADCWRIEGGGHQDLVFAHDAERITLRATPLPDGSFRLDSVPDSLPDSLHVAATEGPEGMRLYLDGVPHGLRVVRQTGGLVVILAGRNHVLHLVDPLAPPPEARDGAQQLTAPLPARVTGILVEPGEIVKKGAPVVVLEAMKMEITLTAPRDGAVIDIRFAVGDVVPQGAELVTLGRGEES